MNKSKFTESAKVSAKKDEPVKPVAVPRARLGLFAPRPPQPRPSFAGPIVEPALVKHAPDSVKQVKESAFTTLEENKNEKGA